MKRMVALLGLLACIALPGLANGAGSAESGRAWFESVCFNCHVDPATAPRFVPARFTPSYLTSAFQRTPAMNGNLQLLNAQAINDVATYLGLVGLGKPDATDTDRLLDWGEDTFPQLLTPTRQTTQQLAGYSYRYYSGTGVYVATKDSTVWFYDSRAPGASIVPLGSLRSYLDQMPNGR